MKIETIETSRLFLRSFTKKDVDFAVSIWNDPDMGEYLSDPSLENMDGKPVERSFIKHGKVG